jgi:hypothetical protein
MKHSMKHPLTIVAFALCLALPLAGQEVPDIKGKAHPSIEFFPLRVTVRIVDDDGQPVEGASVDIGVPNFARYKDGLNNFVGKAKADGIFTAESKASGSRLRSR